VAAAPAAPAPRPGNAAAPAPPAAPAPEARIPRLAELPESTRRELPALVISGSVYSDDPASRFVMVNGEAVREGARLGADLVLEQIRPRELVLRFKGQRYRQPV
jgi:general secretion pathway protein B